MKTSELISELQRLDPTGEATVEIAVGVYTKVFPVAYETPHSVENYTGTVRVNISLPEGYSVAKRKQAA